MCEINGKETWTWPSSIKVFEIDIYQLFVQMRQATPGQMFSLLFSHSGLTNYNSQRQMYPTHVFCLKGAIPLCINKYILY